MEIFTLLRANIRHKKGSFVSVILLSLIIAMSVTTILSIKESAFKGVAEANEICQTPDVWAVYMEFMLTGDLVEELRNSAMVERVEVLDSVIVEKARMGDEEYQYRNVMSLLQADEDIRILKEDLSGIQENAPKLQKGEIYLSQGLLTALHGKTGDRLVLETIAGEHAFTVKGVMLEPVMGSSMIGYKNLCISEADFSEIYSAVIKAETEAMHSGEKKHGLGKCIKIYKADSCALTSGQFRRQLNLDTGVTDLSFGSITRDMSIQYTTLFAEVITSVLFVFIMILLAIVVIVTVHSISVEIETNYVMFGVLKAQGFDKNRICLLFCGQYLLAEVIGSVLGIMLSIPLVSITSNIFVTITAVPAIVSVPAGRIAAVPVGLFALSTVSIFFVTRMINKISPVRAISGAKKEIYFDGRINAPISRRLLSLSLALRQFTSAKRRYAGVLAIVAVLAFFMITVTALAGTVNSKTAIESMGGMVTQIDASPKTRLSDEDYQDIEQEIERFAKIRRAYYSNNAYFSFEGEEMMCCVYKDPASMPVLKGRSPVYNNEIAVSPILLDEFGLRIGDEVTVGWSGKKGNYLITGTVQFMNDAGRSFLMSYEAASEIGYDGWLWCCYSLENGDDETLNAEIVDALNERFGDIIEAEASGEWLDESVGTAIEAMQMIIYAFSSLFSLIVTHMVCSRAFAQERTDIGIYKAVGFMTAGLRRQFAFRFLILAALGSAVGGVLSLFLSDKVLGLFLRSTGLVSFRTNLVFRFYAIPVLIICGSFFVFSYFVSGRIKKVKIRELVTE